MPKILVIDNEVDICEMVKDFFSTRGYEVTSALTGKEGIDAFTNIKPDIVLLDLSLDDVFGMEVLKKIRELKSPCMVIIITGSTLDEYRKEAIKLGAEYYMVKPFYMSRLNELIPRL